MYRSFDFQCKQNGLIAQNAEIKLNGMEIALTGYKIEGKLGELTEITLSGFVDNIDFEIKGMREDCLEINGKVYIMKISKEEAMNEICQGAV